MIYYSFAYGILTIIGGLMGYLKAGSQASLISGGVFGTLILLAAFALLREKAVGYYGLLGLSGVLTMFFIYRLIKTGVMMPAGLMIVLSLVTLAGLLLSKPQFMLSGQ